MAGREASGEGPADHGSRGRRRARRPRSLAVAAACALGVVALVPQFQLWYARGREWQGHAASVHPDEAAYRAYVNALAEGRPRRNDPYTGRDAEMTRAGVETMFSIQCWPAYVLALPGRLFGVPTDTTFVALSFLAAFLALLAVERLIAALAPAAPAARWLSAAGALFVLTLGGPARAQKLVFWLTGQATGYIPLLFLRRYLPAAVFPLFFVFCLLVWRALAREDRRGALARAAAAGVVFALLVYSYFYLWTAALAWLACLAALWLALRRERRRRAAEVFAVVGAFVVAALVPYALMLARRPATMDAEQLLAYTRAPDLFRPPELIGLACAAVLALAARRGLVARSDRAFAFAASFALTPLLVFNQQIITNRSLQPIHYELFIANYLALLAVVLTAALLWRARRAGGETRIAGDVQSASQTVGGKIGAGGDFSSEVVTRPYPRRALAAVAALSLAWALFEMSLFAWRYRTVNFEHDERRAAARKLAELARADETAARSMVFSAETTLSDWQTGVAPQPVLWAAHMHAFGGVAPGEDKERLYTQFYFMGVDEREFGGPVVRRYRGSIFGWGRVVYGLTTEYTPVTPEEERAETEVYARFVKHFDRARAARFPFAHAVVPRDREALMSNLERWYEREEVARAGRYTIYRVRPRP